MRFHSAKCWNRSYSCCRKGCQPEVPWMMGMFDTRTDVFSQDWVTYITCGRPNCPTYISYVVYRTPYVDGEPPVCMRLVWTDTGTAPLCVCVCVCRRHLQLHSGLRGRRKDGRVKTRPPPPPPPLPPRHAFIYSFNSPSLSAKVKVA